MQNLFARLFSTKVAPATALLSAGMALALAGNLAAAVTITTPATMTVTTGTQQIALSASGGTGVYTWSLVSGALPTGLALRTDIPSFFSPTTQQAGLIGVATTPGTYNFTVSLTSGPDTDTRAMTVKVTAFNIKDPSNLPDAFVGGAYTYDFSHINAAGAVTYSVSPGSSLPAGFSLSSAGRLSGPAGAPGFANFGVTASDGTDTVSIFVNLTISAINITTPAILPNGTQNASYTQALSATGGTGAISWSVHGGLPGGLSIVGSSITGTINQGPGTYYFTLNASDTVPNFYSKQMSMTVIGAPPQLLGISSSVPDDATVGDRYTANFTVCCGGVGPITWSATGLPTGLSFRFGAGNTSPFTAAGAVEVWGIPQATGTFVFNLTATGADGQSTTTAINLRVTNLSFTPNPDPGTLGVAYNQPLRVLGGTPPYLAFPDSGLQPFPSGIGVNSTLLTLTGTPLENGSFNPRFSFTDSASNALFRHVPININNVAGSTGVSINDNPDLGVSVRGASYSRTFNASGTGPFTWSLSAGSTPTGLNLSSGGTLSGTPTVAGIYQILVRVTDGTGKTAFRRFWLRISQLTITTSTTLPFGNATTAYTIPALAATGGSGTQTWSLPLGYSLPPGMTLSSAGVLGGIPTSTGFYSFTIEVQDTGGNFGSAMFNISIYPAGGSPPVLISTAANMGQYRLGTQQIELVATGGNGLYTWTLASGTLPPGMSIRTDKPAFFSSAASAGLIGVATTIGTYNFTLTATSGSQSASRAFTLTIRELTVRDPNVPDVYVGQPFTYQFTAINNSGAVTYALSPSTPLPGTMSLSSSGVLSGTVPASGVTPFSFTISDSLATVGHQFNLNVFALRFTSNLNLPSGTQGSVYPTFTVTAAGGSGTFSYAVQGGLPNGLTLNSDGTIVGTINTSPGQYNFNITATDTTAGTANSYTRQMSMVVAGVPPTLPRISLSNFDDFTLGNTFSFGIGSCCGGTPPFTWAVSGLPPGATFRPFGTGSSSVAPGNLEIYGSVKTAGTYPVAVTLTDANSLSTSQTFNLVVGTLDLRSVAFSSSNMPNGTINTPYTYTERVLGGTPPYTASQPQFGTKLPSGLTMTGSTMTVAGTPAENLTYNPIFIFTDAAGTTMKRTSSIQITGGANTINVSNAGINNYDLGVIPVSVFYSNNFGACCIPTGFTWTHISGTLPPGLNLSTTGVLSGTPTTNGTYFFLLRAADSANAGNSGAHEFKLRVSPMSITTSSLPFGNVAAAYNQAFVATGGTGTISWALTPNSYIPPGLALNLTTGALFGTPTSAGNYTFGVQATDSAGTPNVAIRFFNIDIYPAGGYPPLFLSTGPNLSFALGRNTTSLNFSVSGGLAPYHYAYSPSATPIPGFRVQDGAPLPIDMNSGTTAALIGVAPAAGVFTSSIRVTDSASNTFDRPVTAYVLPMMITDQPSLPKATMNVPYLAGSGFQLHPTGGSGAFTFTATSGFPNGLSISSGGLISGTPTGSGSFTLKFNLSNAAVTCPTGVTCNVGISLTLTVDPYSITTGPVLPQATIGTNYTSASPLVTFAAGANCGGTCSWSLTNNSSLPNGLQLDGTTGRITGNPTSGTQTSFTVQAFGTAGTVQKVFALTVGANNFSGLSITTNITNTLSVASALALQMSASGGAPPYTFSLASGTLPPGIALSDASHTGATLAASLNPGFYYLYGRSNAPGPYNFTIQVTDSASATATKAFSLTVTELLLDYTSLPLNPGSSNCGSTPCVPLILNQALPVGGQPMLVLGGTGSYPQWTPSALYPGLTMSTTTGVITGTPANTGSVTQLVTVIDSNGKIVAANVSIDPVSVASGPNVTLSNGPNLGTLSLGGTFNFNITPNGGTGPYTVTPVGALPPGVLLLSPGAVTNSFNAGSWGLQILMTTPGSYSFTLQATDSNGVVGAKTYSYVVTNNSSLITSSLPDAAVGIAYSQRLYSFASGGVTFSLASGSALPAGMAISAAGVLSGTPTTAGTYTFSLNFGDAAAVASSAFTLRVTGLNITSPSVLPIAITGTQYGGPSGYQLTATGGLALTWTVTNLPNGLSANSQGLITGTVPSSSSRFTLTVTVSDGVTSTSKSLALNVKQENPSPLDLPISIAAMSDAIVGQVYQWTISPNGGTPPYTLAVAGGSSLPPGFSLLNPLASNTAPGQFQIGGAPTTPGTYSFDLVLTDSVSATVTRTFTLKVGTLNLTSGNPRNAVIGSPYSLQFAATGGTPPYTFAANATGPIQPALVPGLTLSSAGLLSGTPTSTGSYSFNLTVTDSTSASYTRSFTHNSTNAGGASVTLGNVSTIGGTPASLLTPTANGFNSTPTWSVPTGSLPPGVSIVNGANPTFAGNFTTAGVYDFTLRATDPSNASNFANRSVRWEVSPMQMVAPLVNPGGTIALPVAKTGTPYSFTYKVAGGTPPYTFVESPFSPLPPGLSLSSAGVLSGTPTQTGLFQIRPIVTDAASARLLVTTASVGIVSPVGRQNLFPLNRTNDQSGSVGSYFSFPLDSLVLGVPPYTFSVSSGTLPPGLAILPGANGVGSYLAGTPTTGGDYPFTLAAADSGQTVSLPLGLQVGPLTLTPQNIPSGIVGTPYSVSFVASGGTAPYQLVLAKSSSSVPGLTLSGGTLSGTPTIPGVFAVTLNLSDSAGTPNQLARTYLFTVDNATGQAPAISIAPKPVNILYIQGDPAPVVPLTVGSTSGGLAFTGAVLGLPSASLSATAGTTSANPNLTINTSGLGVGRYSGLVGVNSSAALYNGDATPINLTVLAPPPCTYSITPGSAVHTINGGAGSFNISTGPACAWSAAVTGSLSSWLTLTGTTSGIGNGTVAYNMEVNGNLNQRIATITAGGQTFSVTQFGVSCRFAIRPTVIDALPSGGSATIDVFTNGATCEWPASSGLSVVVPPGTPAGTGQATITIPANVAAGAVVLTGVIAGQTITVNQAGAACIPTLSSPGTTMASGGGSGSVAITAALNCPYTTIVGPAWISVTSGGSGNIPASLSSNITFSVAPNSTTSTRSGNILIGGQPFLITQDGLACSVTLDTSALPSPFSVAGGNGTLGISANGPNCAWTAASNSGFASVNPTRGTGSGTVTVNLTSNAGSATARTGSLNISGQNVNIAQAGTTCTYALRALTSNVPSTGGVGSVGVIAPSACSWTAVSNSAFLTVISGAASNGTQEVQFVVAPSASAAPQTGTLTIAGQNFTVTQGAAPCTFTLASNSVSIGSPGVTGSTLNYSATLTGCSVTPISYASWLTVFNSFVGTDGTLTYSAAPNPSGSTRVGNIQIGDKVFRVTQSGAACAYSLNSYGAGYNKLGGNGTILGSPNALGCTPVTGTSQPTIIQLPPLGGPTLNIFNQDYIVNPFNSVVKAIRRATITFGGQIFTVKQTSY